MGAKSVYFTTDKAGKIRKWKVKEGMLVSARQVILLYDVVGPDEKEQQLKFKSTEVGTVRKRIAKEGDIVHPGGILLELEECSHPTVMKDMCAECGADLRRDEQVLTSASVPMVHSIPELKVSQEQAQIIGKADENRLIGDNKLVLLVDLDQTLIHTTNDNIPPNLKDVYHFQLYGPTSPWYHTRIRPRTQEFLQEISKMYELHICTFGARNYAHTIAMFLDPDGKYFSHRILSRDECFNANSKTANLKALFPCGDNMVCIIDDREDVWNFAPNLIHVKPYHFFKHTGDINAPPGLAKKENDDIEGYDFTKLDKADAKGKDPVIEVGKESKPPTQSSKPKSGELGESTTEKDTEDEEELTAKGKEEPKTEETKTEETKTEKTKTEREREREREVEIEKVTGDLQLSEDDSDEATETDGKKKTPSVALCDNSVEGEKKEGEEASTEVKEAEESAKEGDKKEDKGDAELVEVEDNDDYLLYLEDILKNIHKAYYKLYSARGEDEAGIPDLKEVIPRVKGTVLEGCHLVFSGLVPSYVPLQQSRAYSVAVALGATVSPDISATTTHLVAARPGTVKVNSARRHKGLLTVTPLWLWSCAERWERLDERLYPLGRGGVANRHPPAHCGSPQHSPQHETADYAPAARERTLSGRFIDTINPLLTFSSEDMQIMDQEVADLFKEDDDSDSDDKEGKVSVKSPAAVKEEEESSSNSSTEDSLSGAAHPKGWTDGRKKLRKRKMDTTTCTESEYEESPSVKFRRGEPLPSDLDFGEESQESPPSEEPLDDVDDGDWSMMGAALEREFLSGE